MEISNILQDNIAALKKTFIADESLLFREFSIGGAKNVECVAVYVDGLVNVTRINDEIISPLLDMKASETNTDIYLPSVLKNKITSAQLETTGNYNELTNFLLNGYTSILMDGYKQAIVINTSGMERRKISEPDTEKVVRGPREGFNESLFTNISLLRSRIKSESLKLHFREVGRLTKTKVCLCYLENVASLDTVKEVERRLDHIDIDGILDSGYIQELISDERYSPFRTIGHTEKPDVVAGKLLEGRLAIFCDGSPFVLTLPYIFIEYFHVSEDYYSNYYYVTFNRLLSFTSFFITTSIPAIYTALITFHQEMLPTPLILSISAARQGIPLPTIAEMILILFVFEVLREASLRIPTVVGQTISIVGALIIGQAAVEAKLISAPIIIVAAASGLTSFLVPKMEQGVIIVRLVFLLSSAFLGLYGYIFSVIAMYIHLASMKSFGIPYMLFISSLSVEDQKDVLIRAPWWLIKKRPKLIAEKNIRRQKS
ncbi:MAG TPA: spore germination protein [Clostridia bacterium]|nr:spore germination protein [Clostridia bacterium]